ncbi:MAG: hypothetical protein AB8B96_17280 [Lysobacterales bacterium]
MSIKTTLALVGRAAAVATLTVGTLAAGLTVTTYTVAKANEMMFEQPVTTLKVKQPACV